MSAVIRVMLTATLLVGQAAAETETIFNDAANENRVADMASVVRAVKASSSMLAVAIALLLAWCWYGRCYVDRDAYFAARSA